MAVHYQSQILDIQPSGNPSLAVNVPVLQSVNFGISLQRSDVTRLGKFAPMPYRPVPQWPTPTMEVEYIPTGKVVEESLRLTNTGSMIGDLFFSSSNDSTATFVMKSRELVPQGQENEFGTISLQSGVVTNYSFQASVGQTPRANFSIEGTDAGFDTGSFTPAVQENNFPILQPQDMTAPDLTGLFGVEEAHLQSFNISVPLSRTPLYKIGEQKPFSRELQSPVIATVQFNAILSKFRPTTTGNIQVNQDSDDIQKLVCGKFLDETMNFTIYEPSCNFADQKTNQIMNFEIKRPYLDNISYSNSVGGYLSVDAQLSIPLSPVGAGFDHAAEDSNIIIS